MLVRHVGAPLVAREPELAVLRDFFDNGVVPAALVLTGGPGIGKTTLWEAGVAAARQHGSRVLTARATGAETCSFLYEAASVDAVHEAVRRAGISYERVSEALITQEDGSR